MNTLRELVMQNAIEKYIDNKANQYNWRRWEDTGECINLVNGNHKIHIFRKFRNGYLLSDGRWYPASMLAFISDCLNAYS